MASFLNILRSVKSEGSDASRSFSTEGDTFDTAGHTFDTEGNTLYTGGNTFDTYDSGTDTDGTPHLPSMKEWFYGEKSVDGPHSENGSSSSSDGTSIPEAPSELENKVLTLLSYPSSSCSQSGSVSTATADGPSIQHIYDIHSLQESEAANEKESTVGTDEGISQEGAKGPGSAPKPLGNKAKAEAKVQRGQIECPQVVKPAKRPMRTITLSTSEVTGLSQAKKIPEEKNRPEAKTASRWNLFQRKSRRKNKEKPAVEPVMLIEREIDELSEVTHKSTTPPNEKEQRHLENVADAANEESSLESRSSTKIEVTYSKISNLSLPEKCKSPPSNDDVYSTQGFEVPLDRVSTDASMKLKKKRSFLRWGKNQPEPEPEPEHVPIDHVVVCESSDEIIPHIDAKAKAKKLLRQELPKVTENVSRRSEGGVDRPKVQNGEREEAPIGSDQNHSTARNENPARDLQPSGFGRGGVSAGKADTGMSDHYPAHTVGRISMSEPVENGLGSEKASVQENRSLFDFIMFSSMPKSPVSTIDHQTKAVEDPESVESSDNNEGLLPEGDNDEAKSLPANLAAWETLSVQSGNMTTKRNSKRGQHPDENAGESPSLDYNNAINGVALSRAKAKKVWSPSKAKNPKAVKKIKLPPLIRGGSRFSFSSSRDRDKVVNTKKDSDETPEPESSTENTSKIFNATGTASSVTEGVSPTIQNKPRKEKLASVSRFPFSLKRQHSAPEKTTTHVPTTKNSGKAARSRTEKRQSCSAKNKLEKPARSRSPFGNRKKPSFSVSSLRRQGSGPSESNDKEKNGSPDPRHDENPAVSHDSKGTSDSQVTRQNASEPLAYSENPKEYVVSETVETSPPFWNWNITPKNSPKQSNLEHIAPEAPPNPSANHTETTGDATLASTFALVSGSFLSALLPSNQSEVVTESENPPVREPPQTSDSADNPQELLSFNGPMQDEPSFHAGKSMSPRRKSDSRSMVGKFKGKTTSSTKELLHGWKRHHHKTVENSDKTQAQPLTAEFEDKTRHGSAVILPKNDNDVGKKTETFTPQQSQQRDVDHKTKEPNDLTRLRALKSQQKSDLSEMVGKIKGKKIVETVELPDSHDYPLEDHTAQSRHQCDDSRTPDTQSRTQPESSAVFSKHELAGYLPPVRRSARMRQNSNLQEMVSQIKEEKKNQERTELEATKQKGGSALKTLGRRPHSPNNNPREVIRRNLLRGRGRTLQEENIFLDSLAMQHVVDPDLHTEKWLEQNERERVNKARNDNDEEWYNDLLPWTWSH